MKRPVRSGTPRPDIPLTAEEQYVMRRVVRAGDIVFDVHAGAGRWSGALLDGNSAELHVFEALDEAAGALGAAHPDLRHVNWAAVSSCDEEAPRGAMSNAKGNWLSRRFRRTPSPRPQAPRLTLDTYWADRTGQIRFVRIGDDKCVYDVLRGAGGLLRAGRIDFLQLEVGEDGFGPGVSPRVIQALLRRYGYRFLSVDGDRFSEAQGPPKGAGRAHVFAVHERMVNLMTGDKARIELEFTRMAQFAIRPSGVLHVGAHVGEEIRTYRAHGVSPVVFVEANPDLAATLRERFAEDGDVTIIEAAASDTEGTATFNITTMDQSSSLLDLKKHADLYPGIRVGRKIEVRTARLDRLMAEAGIDLSEVNFLAMDIQGAELMALHGAVDLLKHIDAIQLEVNYAHLYHGCPLAPELDAFLGEHGFIRVSTKTPYSPDWGDALYVRRPRVACSSIGRTGQFSDDLFRYMFLQSYARDHDYVAINPPWAGDDIFAVPKGGAAEPDMPFRLEEQASKLAKSNIAVDLEVRPETDFVGKFQYHTRYYRPHKALIQNHFSFKDAYADRAAKILRRFEACPGPVACIHLSREVDGNAPVDWYSAWLAKLEKSHPDLIVYVASEGDGVPSVPGGFDIITAADLPGDPPSHAFFDDFAALALGDFTAISAAPFSFVAAMLNNRSKCFMRPAPRLQALKRYDPWNAPVAL